jgi:hypothetical protein
MEGRRFLNQHRVEMLQHRQQLADLHIAFL